MQSIYTSGSLARKGTKAPRAPVVPSSEGPGVPAVTPRRSVHELAHWPSGVAVGRSTGQCVVRRVEPPPAEDFDAEAARPIKREEVHAVAVLVLGHATRSKRRVAVGLMRQRRRCGWLVAAGVLMNDDRAGKRAPPPNRGLAEGGAAARNEVELAEEVPTEKGAGYQGLRSPHKNRSSALSSEAVTRQSRTGTRFPFAPLGVEVWWKATLAIDSDVETSRVDGCCSASTASTAAPASPLSVVTNRSDNDWAEGGGRGRSSAASGGNGPTVGLTLLLPFIMLLVAVAVVATWLLMTLPPRSPTCPSGAWRNMPPVRLAPSPELCAMAPSSAASQAASSATSAADITLAPQSIQARTYRSTGGRSGRGVGAEGALPWLL